MPVFHLSRISLFMTAASLLTVLATALCAEEEKPKKLSMIFEEGKSQFIHCEHKRDLKTQSLLDGFESVIHEKTQLELDSNVTVKKIHGDGGADLAWTAQALRMLNNAGLPEESEVVILDGEARYSLGGKLLRKNKVEDTEFKSFPKWIAQERVERNASRNSSDLPDAPPFGELFGVAVLPFAILSDNEVKPGDCWKMEIAPLFLGADESMPEGLMLAYTFSEYIQSGKTRVAKLIISGEAEGKNLEIPSEDGGIISKYAFSRQKAKGQILFDVDKGEFQLAELSVDIELEFSKFIKGKDKPFAEKKKSGTLSYRREPIRKN